jgi:hypothetical protein
VCVSVALVIQHAKRVRRILLSCVACQVLPYFSTLSHKRHDACKKMLLNTKCVLIFHLRKNWARYDKNVYRSSRKVPLFLSDFQCNLNSLDTFLENSLISNFMEIRPVGAELFHEEGRTDRQTWWSYWSLSVIMRTHPKTDSLWQCGVTLCTVAHTYNEPPVWPLVLDVTSKLYLPEEWNTASSI